MLKRTLFAVLVLVLFTACNKTTSVTNKEEGTTPPAEKLSTAVYPHGKDFYKNHGALFLEKKEQCLACHGPTGAGGNTKVSCTQCHQNFPHPEGFMMPDKHPVAFVKNPQSCATCHGTDWKGGKSKVACLTCHQNFPHPLGFAAPTQHGKAFVAAADKSECLSCHDPAKKAGEGVAARCDSCHAAFPHPEGFEYGHGDLARSYLGKCTNCHRGYKENMPKLAEKGGCTSCHKGEIKIFWPDGFAAHMKSKDRLPSSPLRSVSPHKLEKKSK